MNASTQSIEADLNQSREALSTTMEELGRKLSPGQLLDEAIGLAKGQTSVFVSNLGKQVRDNPLPVVLIGAGIAWLAMSRNQSGHHAVLSAEDWDTEHRYRQVEQAGWGIQRNADETEDAFKQRLRQAQGAALQMKQNAGEAMHAFHERIDKTVASLQQAASATRDRLGSAFSGAAHFAQDQVRHAADASVKAAHKAEDFYAQNPLAAGAIAMGVGALLGSAVPLSQRERETLQGVADGATKVGADLAERGLHAVQDRASAPLN